MAKLVYARDLGSRFARSGGSSPFRCTKGKMFKNLKYYLQNKKEVDDAIEWLAGKDSVSRVTGRKYTAHMVVIPSYVKIYFRNKDGIDDNSLISNSDVPFLISKKDFDKLGKYDGIHDFTAFKLVPGSLEKLFESRFDYRGGFAENVIKLKRLEISFYGDLDSVCQFTPEDEFLRLL